MSLRKVRIIRPGVFVFIFLALVLGLVSCFPARTLQDSPTVAPRATVPSTAAEIQVLIPTFTPGSPAGSPAAIPSPAITPTLPVETPTPVPTPEPVTYTVQSGDTLLGIALDHNVDSSTLMAINNITDPNTLAVGQVLQIPPPSYTAAGSTNKTVPYPVENGDSFYSIAEKFGVSAINLQNANPDIETLQVGDVLQIPWDGVHIVAWGDTLSGISARYGVDFDTLVGANTDVLDLNNLHHIEVGWQLTIPVLVVEQNEAGEEVVVVYDCNPVAPRTGVIEYTVQNGERLYCLSSKFGVDMPTLLYANPQIIGQGALADGVTIQVPPSNGALYTVTEADIANGSTLADIAQWYQIARPDDIVDWQGNQVALPLAAGQQLFIPAADPLAGAFNSGVLVAFNQGNQESIEITEPGSGIVDPEPAPEVAAGRAPFDGGLARHWNDPIAPNSPGYCAWQDGSGWSGSLGSPVDNLIVPEDKRFYPGHAAVDIDVPEGSPVYAAESGVVIYSGFSLLGGGIKVILGHGNWWRTHYVHLSSALVPCGQYVSRGALIGLSGKTGTNNWPHLHFEVNQGNIAHDPCIWLACN